MRKYLISLAFMVGCAHATELKPFVTEYGSQSKNLVLNNPLDSKVAVVFDCENKIDPWVVDVEAHSFIYFHDCDISSWHVK